MFDNAQPDHRWPPRTNRCEMRRAVNREWPLSATKNGELRLLNQEVARAFFSRVLAQAKPHMSDEHFPARKSFQNLSQARSIGSPLCRSRCPIPYVCWVTWHWGAAKVPV